MGDRHTGLRGLLARLALAFLLSQLCLLPVYAQSEGASGQDTQAYYEEQLRESGAGQLPGKLPEETRRALSALGMSGDDFQDLGKLTPRALFSEAFGLAGTEGKGPLKAAASCLAVIVLCALIDAMKVSLGEQPLGGVMNVVGTLCICLCVAQPVVHVLLRGAAAIQTACGFSVAAVPVGAGVLAALGRPASAASMQLLLTAAGDGLQLLSAKILLPGMQMLLALSVVSALSPDVNLGGLCKFFAKALKWLLGLGMTLFIGVLTVRGVVAGGADTAGGKALRFVVSSFVPVVGGALSDGMRAVSGCVEMLRAGLGGFLLLAMLLIFLPVLLSVLLWMLTLWACAAVAEIFSLREAAALLHACSTVLQVLLATLLCAMAVLVVSGAVLLMMGGAAT